MSRCLLVYFSQTGSTAKIASAIAAAFRSAEWDIDLCNLKEGYPPDINKYDMLGLGSPVYYFRLPMHFRSYVKSLPDLSQKKVFIFLLYGAIPGLAAQEIKRLLLRKRARINGLLQTRGIDYFLGYLKAGWLLSPDSPTISELGEAELFGRTMAVAPPNGMMFGSGNSTAKKLAHSLLKLLISPWLTRIVYSRFFKVNIKKCAKCDICLQQCPVKNINHRHNGYPVWGRNCILCFACEQTCPKDAIKSPVDWFIFKMIVQYFLHASLSDTTVTRTRVQHRNGKTEKVT